MQFLNLRRTTTEYGKIWVGCWIEKICPVEVANEAGIMQTKTRVRLPVCLNDNLERQME
jgi:hypothetical protein